MADARRNTAARIVIQVIVRSVPIVLVTFGAERFLSVLHAAGFPLWERTVLVVVAVIAIIVAFVWLSNVLTHAVERGAARLADHRTGTV